MAEKFNIWEGIYSSFEEASSDAQGAGFEGDIYNERALKVAIECLESLENGKPIPPFHKQRSNLLPPVVAMMLGQRKHIKILDFGGGLGIGYMTLKESIPDCSSLIDYSIVEFADICSQGRNLNGKNILFLDELPATGEFDLIHSASALQYVEDWKGLLQKFISYNPEYVLLSDVFAGTIPTFVTLQNYYGSKMKHWFLNSSEFIDYFSSLGYKLTMKSYVNSRRLDADDILPMSNFPETHRIQQTLHLLFKKTK